MGIRGAGWGYYFDIDFQALRALGKAERVGRKSVMAQS
jgi:hypothetical protein